ncbi:adenosylcobinamide-GDP ribazoletransferase [Frigidibacter sp. ROC022]|uniref:adenosylcobinamide-GDP ribazoletransferase n=1 Tax=Frigidibacter sp. ROC022 TaxID=2971796 RepID=UPI00215A88FA|nr:adenosylcobinamide-GDP ribazoletransferase [Frigidibacter sp. ROC022]MCR8723416.1 adenosylcobinamide-GDP ribazoletransferase [Frigidibacter sp. ROC022]
MSKADPGLIEAEDISVALGLLTRLPVPGGTRGARAAWAWPVAGFLVALIAGLCGWFLLAIGLVPGVAAATVLGILAMLTGAMHEDGLADSADGLFGGWTVARRLEIMKDSRIGTYGMLALLLVTLARWSALSFLLATGHTLAPLIVAAMLSRAALPLAMIAMPNARGEGLSQSAGVPPRPSAALGLVLALIAAIALLGWAAIPVVLAAAVPIIALALLAQVKIGGQTGDILGAMQQLGEVAVLSALCGLV